jgi:hypothetical protein
MGNCEIAVGAARCRSTALPMFTALLAMAAPWYVASIALSGATGWAADPTNKATTSHAAHDDALRTIPLDKLPADARPKVAAVLNDTSLFRRLPVQVVDCEPELFNFMESNPDVIVNIWQLMGVTNVKLDRIDGNRFHCSDGDGTTARAEIIYRNQDTEIIYADGLYEGPLFPRAVRGQCVGVLKTASQRDTNGRFYVTVRLDTFLHVDNVGVELLAKIFQGLVGRTIDHNFEETVGFLGSVSRTAETNPRGMQRLATKLTHIEPNRRDDFVALTDQVSSKLAGVELAESDTNPALTGVVQSAATEPQRPTIRGRQ